VGDPRKVEEPEEAERVEESNEREAIGLRLETRVVKPSYSMALSGRTEQVWCQQPR